MCTVMNHRVSKLTAIAIFCLAPLPSAHAAEWSNTEMHFLYGKLDTPEFAGGGDANTKILTLQHASGWEYGSNFFFVNFNNSGKPEFNDREMYAELYSFFSWNRIRGNEYWPGLVKDTGFIAGLNWSTDLRLRKYLPGVRFALNIPKFDFANLDVTAYIDDSDGVANGGVPAQDDSFMIDFNWGLPFSVGKQKFRLDGHIEYIGERDDEFGNTVSWHILAQPEFRYDLGNGLWGEAKANRLFVGMELQVWINKLGDKTTDEFAPMALVVWRF